MSTKDYHRFFDPHAFLNTYYNTPKLLQYGYQQLVNFWTQNKQKDLKVLEYGGGPAISRLVSACPHVKDFIFAEYLEANRQAVQAWIDKEPKAFDWRPAFEFIVQELEGKGPDEVAQREDELRHKIRAIVPCDIKAENILDIPDNLGEKYGPPYDVVATSICIEVAVESEQEYKNAWVNLAKLVKPGGYLLMHGVLEETYYMVGSTKFYTFPITKELMLESMKSAGLKEIRFELASDHCPREVESKERTNSGDLFFASGRT